MSVSGGSREVQRAAVKGVTASGAGTLENDSVITATEDREIVFVYLQTVGNSAGDVSTVEASFSSQSFMIGPGVENLDNTRAAVLGFCGMSGAGATGVVIVNYDDGPVQWDSGEEVNIHARNDSSSDETYRVIIGYREV